MKPFLIATILIAGIFSSADAQLNLQWQELGPDNFGGPIRGLILDNRDATRQTLYAGAMGGGVWKTTNGGNSWNFLGCAGSYAVSCISQASNGTIYFGTGDELDDEGFGSSFSEAHLGNGIYKLDSVDNFIHLDSTTGGVWEEINHIAINPVNANMIIVANEGGLYKSNDGGNSWTKVTITAFAGLAAIDVKWSTDGQKILAVFGGPFSGFLARSLNGGNTWSRVNSATNPGFPSGTLGRIEIAFAPSNSNVAYLSIATYEGCTYGVFKTLDAGDTWDSVALKSNTFDPFTEDCQGWFDNAIAVSPVDSSIIYVGGVSMYSYSPNTGMNLVPPFIDPNITSGDDIEQFIYIVNDLNPNEVYVASEEGVFKASNALTNFAAPDFYSSNNALDAKDFNSIAAARNGRVMGGSDNSGALVSNIGSQSFSRISQGIGFCDFSQLDTNYSFIEGDWGQLYMSPSDLSYFFSAFDTNIDPQMYGYPSRCGAYSIVDDAPYIAPFLLCETKSAYNTNDSVIFISNAAQSAGDILNVTSATANTIFQYVLSGPIQPGDSIRVSDPVKSRLFFSTNCGVWMKLHAINLPVNPDWYQISTASSSVPYCFAATKDGNTVYAATDAGIVLAISGLNFANYTNYSMADSFQVAVFHVANGRPIEGIALDPNNDSILLVAVAGYSADTVANVYKSTDAGHTWTPILVGPQNIPAYCCVIDVNNSNNYMVGTEQGIWSSNDAGATWQQDDDGMCDVPVYRLRQIPLLQDDCYILYAATNSRGLWRSFSLTPAGCNISVGIQPTPIYANDFRIYPNPASTATNIEFIVTEPQLITISVLDITGRIIQQLERQMPRGNQIIELNTSMLQVGTYLINLQIGGTQKTKLLVISE